MYDKEWRTSCTSNSAWSINDDTNNMFHIKYHTTSNRKRFKEMNSNFGMTMVKKDKIISVEQAHFSH